jgi:hypothetical protein
MDEPEVKQIGDTFYVTEPHVLIEVAKIREHSDSITAEVRAVEPTTGLQHWAAVNLASTQARATFAKAMAAIGIDPSNTLERVVWTIVKRSRVGLPARPLLPSPPATTSSWLVAGLIPVGETSVLYADGGSGKSLVALALAVAGLTGRPVAGHPSWQVAPLRKVLYLDWESQYEDHAERLFGLSALWRGGGEIAPESIIYQPMARGLTDQLPAIQASAAGCELVIVDSLGAACGAEPDGADAAIRTLNALRTLAPATRLVIAHVTKQAADGAGPARPYGSAFIWNLARSVVEVKRDDHPRDDGAMTVTFTHRKLNRGPKQPPRALKFSFDEHGYISVDIDEPDFSRLSLPARILRDLKGGEKSVQEIAESLGANVRDIRARLNEMQKGTESVRSRSEGIGRGKKSYWGLIDRKRTGDGR